MNNIIGIRREDKNQWERRVPLIPKHIRELDEKYGIKIFIQPSSIRVFSDESFKKAGANVQEDISHCPVVFAVKEIPIDFFSPNKTYVFFSHTIKGQKYNMPMLKKMMNMGCNLIDYEKIADKNGRRLVFFGRFAGIAGMVDTLWAFGKRLKSKGVETPFNKIKQAVYYKDIEEIKNHFIEVGKQIRSNGIPESLAPLVIGFAGYGNVSKGAQEMLDYLPLKEVSPDQIESIQENYSDKLVYKVVFKEEHMVEPVSKNAVFNLQEYYNKPELYRSIFHQYISNLSILMNCIYWSKKYPRLVTKDFLKKNFSNHMKLQIVGDISVDVNGAIEFTEKTTSTDDPVFVYDPLRDKIERGYNGEGVVVLGVDNLPCELPASSSEEFSDSLMPFVPDVVKANYSVKFSDLELPSEVKKAVILHNGELTPDYQYINKFL
jgi:alpha-aminoadipic semialdehyde synthase